MSHPVVRIALWHLNISDAIILPDGKNSSNAKRLFTHGDAF